MNRNLEIFSKIYKPYKIEKKNNVFIFKTMDGNYVIKINPKIDYRKLYSYLLSRSFDYVPKLSPDSRDDAVVLEYIEDVSIDKNQKILDLINLVSLLHSKTSYYKEITLDRYKELYEQLKNNVLFIDTYYEEMFMKYLYNEYNGPYEYLLLRNYTLIYNACKYCLDKIEKWYLSISDKNKQRGVLVHNNLKLDHYLKNESEYLISWDKYIIDSPVLDLVNLYKNEWEDITFKEVLDTYNNSFSLLDEEKILFNILISIPYKIDNDLGEYDKCRELRRLINYLNKSSSLVSD